MQLNYPGECDAIQMGGAIELPGRHLPGGAIELPNGGGAIEYPVFEGCN